MRILLGIILGGLPLSLWAEYRLYQYYVKAPATLHQSVDRDSYLVTSSLDPVSYVAYHGGKGALKVSLLRSWMCKGHTAGRPLCPPPLSSVPLEAAAPSPLP